MSSKIARRAATANYSLGTTCYGTPRVKEKHGMTGSPEHNVWRNLLERCFNPKSIGYSHYGGRGITVCDAWASSFKAFYRDVGPRPSPMHSLDRIVNSRGYEPGNVRWATRIVQQQNTSRNVYMTYKGETFCASEWARRFSLDRHLVKRRIHAGLPPEEVLAQPKRRPLELRGLSFHKLTQKWRAYLPGIPRIHVGSFKTIEEARNALVGASS